MITMKIASPLTALALAAAALLAVPAHAATVIDTGAPTNGAIGANAIDSFNWLAEKFTLAGPTLIDSISAYVLSDATDIGKSFTLAVYGNSALNTPALNFNAGNQNQLFQTGIVYGGNGWNSSGTGLNWSLGAGSYWFAIEEDSNGPASLLLPTGTASPALAVASYSGGVSYSTSGLGTADTFGLQVSSVPEPTGIVLAFTGLLALGLRSRQRG
jgi:hypothetical protein